MQDTRLLTAVDVGTTKVCTIIGRVKGSSPELLGHSVVPCGGLKKGIVEDLAATAKAMRMSITEAERKAGVHVRSVHVGVTGAHVSFENRSDTLEWIGSHGVVTAEEMERVPEMVASTSTAEANRKVLHALPMSYTVDGATGITNPLGMHTSQVEVETHVVTGASSFIGKLVETVEKTGLTLESLVLEPLASGLAVLTPEERKEGVVLVDIGGGTTDVVAFSKGRICYTTVIPVAGHQFTNDICHVYNTPYEAAEEAKLKYAHTMLHAVRQHEEVSLPVVGSTTELSVPRSDICQLMRERAQELMHLIKIRLQESPLEDISKVKVVMTGGTANLPGLQELAQQNLVNRVRIGLPEGPGGIPDELRAPAYATGVGILLWAMSQPKRVASPSKNGKEIRANAGRRGPIHRFFKRLGNLLHRDLVSARQGRS